MSIKYQPVIVTFNVVLHNEQRSPCGSARFKLFAELGNLVVR
jgi:hypothetical protein